MIRESKLARAVDSAIARSNAAFVQTLCSMCLGTGRIYTPVRNACQRCSGTGKR